MGDVWASVLEHGHTGTPGGRHSGGGGGGGGAALQSVLAGRPGREEAGAGQHHYDGSVAQLQGGLQGGGLGGSWGIETV